MKIIHINDKTETDITQLVTSITWSGDSKQVARSLTFGIVASNKDKNIPAVNIKLGDVIKALDGNTERYRGYVFTKDKTLSGNVIEFTSYDGLIYLLKSTATYNFKNVTPGAITKRICKEFGIPTGKIINGSPISRVFEGEDIYSIIMAAYTLESDKTKRQYIPLMNKGKLEILEKGKKIAKYELDPNTSITDAKYSESIENSINVVKVYDDEGVYKGEVTLTGVPGRLQDTYKGDKGKQGARTLLKGLEQTASLKALGDFECVAGNAVGVKEETTGLVGLFFIESDKHTFENGVHMMDLGLAFENIMDRVVTDDE